MGSKVVVTRSKLDLLADSVSAKSGESLPLTIGEMKVAVDGIVLNSQIIGDGELEVDENDYLYFDDNGGGGITPTGTINITTNGTHDVTNYASANVNVSTSVQTQTKSATPSESQQTITPDSGYYLSSVTVGAIDSGYVVSGVSRKSSTDLTVSGATVTAPAGYYESAASKSIASGSAGTPSASKGTVSNHSISVTPSVTNTTGYITGGTKTGTAVTVTASELASGNKEITSNGTNIDVVGYSTVSVAVPSSSTAIITDTTDAAGGTIRTITTTDEVYLQTKTITPTSSQQTVLPDTGYDGFSSVIVGASSGGTPSATAHSIYFEFSDSTNTTITAYYDDSFISNAITATTPTTYGNKTVTLAQLDNVTWYEPSAIPLNTQLIDYTSITLNHGITGSDGTEYSQDAIFCSDYTVIDPSMTFTYKGYRWSDMAFYDSSKTYISGTMQETYADSNDSNDISQGTLNPSRIPSNAMYIRLTSYPSYYSSNPSYMSLIRTA